MIKYASVLVSTFHHYDAHGAKQEGQVRDRALGAYSAVCVCRIRTVATDDDSQVRENTSEDSDDLW